MKDLMGLAGILKLRIDEGDEHASDASCNVSVMCEPLDAC